MSTIWRQLIAFPPLIENPGGRQGMLKKLKWYEANQFIVLTYRWGTAEEHPSIDLEIHNIDDLSSTFSIYQGESSYKELVGRVRVGGLPSIQSEETEEDWILEET